MRAAIQSTRSAVVIPGGISMTSQLGAKSSPPKRDDSWLPGGIVPGSYPAETGRGTFSHRIMTTAAATPRMVSSG
jgi:hypothetical protein